MHTQSDILTNSVDFLLRKKAQQFIKAREAVIRCKHASALNDLKETSRQHRIELEYLMQTTGQDFNADDVIENYCGFGREWVANDRSVTQAADEHGISKEAARDMLEATLTQAQLYSQTTKGNMIGIYTGWLSDLCPDNDHPTNEQADKELQATITDAYKKAGEWLRRDEGLLIEASAEDWQLSLPKWGDVLPKATAATEQAKRKIQSNLEHRAEQLRVEALEAMATINGQDW